MRIRIPRRLLLGAVLLPAALLGCGRKGPPVPPRPVGPAAAVAFRAEPSGNAILVSWARPARSEDGSPLTDLREFRLYRTVGGAGPRPAGERPPLVLLATVRADRPDNAIVRGDRYGFRDDGGSAGLTPGLRYAYRVQAVNRRGVAGPLSPEVVVEYTLAPPPPVSLTATAGDGVVNLRWQAPPPVPPGARPPQGYNIYRALQPGAYGEQPINAGPLVAVEFRDVGVENGATYYYVVRSVGSERPPWRESASSNEASATPVDLTPPAPPRGLTAIPAPGAVSLIWEANTEPDLLGYLVYRREPPALAPVRLTDRPTQTTTFTDRAVRAGATYAYTVTAVDRSPHRNESAPSPEFSVTLP